MQLVSQSNGFDAKSNANLAHSDASYCLDKRQAMQTINTDTGENVFR